MRAGNDERLKRCVSDGVSLIGHGFHLISSPHLETISLQQYHTFPYLFDEYTPHSLDPLSSFQLGPLICAWNCSKNCSMY